MELPVEERTEGYCMICIPKAHYEGELLERHMSIALGQTAKALNKPLDAVISELLAAQP